MEANCNTLLLEKDPSAKILFRELADNDVRLDLQQAFLYFSFPLYRESEDSSSRVNVLLVSRKHGLFIFECVNSNRKEDEVEEALEKLEQVSSQVFSRLIKSRLLRSSVHSLNFPTFQVLFSPGLTNRPYSEDVEIITSIADLHNFIRSKMVAEMPEDNFSEIVAVLEGSKAMTRKARKLEHSAQVTKGHILERIETAISNFDLDQKRAALNIIDGPQRIRGLAGSGKTIVLAWKAALIHLQDPEATILYTFYTKSLYDLIRRLITKFYRHFSDMDPDWNKVHVLHAWGGQSLPGVYFLTCRENGLSPRRVQDVPSYERDKFDFICNEILPSNLKKMYDYSLLDEAQDFPKSFYRLCNKITKKKRVIWGYDECQNILDIDLQDPKAMFGNDENGLPEIDLSVGDNTNLNDIVLHRCYRNPKDILMYSFALGFGLYNNRILQMLENNDHWEDLGFKVLHGNSNQDDQMEVSRPDENSPLGKVANFNESPLTARGFSNVDQECQYVVDKIEEDLKSNLSPEDILVISLDDYNSKLYFAKLQTILSERGIDVHDLNNAPNNNTVFVRPGFITLSTVYRAKGNEAASVYVVGVDQIFKVKDSIRDRNKLFTAFTRAKVWLTVTGTGTDSMALFFSEWNAISADAPTFKFKMPNRETMKNFNRDLGASTSLLSKMSAQIEEMSRRLNMSPEEIMNMLAQQTKVTKK